MLSFRYESFLFNFAKALVRTHIFQIRLDSYKSVDSLDCEMLAETDTAHFTSPPMFDVRAGDLTYLTRLLTYYRL